MKAITFSSLIVVLITSINIHVALQQRIDQRSNINDTGSYTWVTSESPDRMDHTVKPAENNCNSRNTAFINTRLNHSTSGLIKHCSD